MPLCVLSMYLSGYIDNTSHQPVDLMPPSFDSNALLFEMMKSFITLAETLNLSHAVQELGSTRQTVRRHISALEKKRGEALFEVVDNRYVLTKTGQRALPEAKLLIARGEFWAIGETGLVDGLFHYVGSHETIETYIQQHPISEVWKSRSKLMKRALIAWTESESRIDHPAFDEIRNKIVVFRYINGSWICVDVGSESSYATWYGRDWEKSSIGLGLPMFPGGDRMASILAEPYAEVMATKGVRFDHTQTVMSHHQGSPPEPVSYVRLLLGCHLPDSSFALMSVIERTHDICIQGMSEERRLAMDASWVSKNLEGPLPIVR